MKPCLLSILVVMAAAVGSDAGQRARAEAREARLRQWLDAAGQHRAGTIGPTAIELAAWSDAELKSLVEDVRELSRFLARAHERFRRTGERPTFAYAGRDLEMSEVQQLLGVTDAEAARGEAGRLALRGALLHTDFAVTLDAIDRRTRPVSRSDRPTTLLVLDGREQGTVDRGPHWQFARALMDLIGNDSPYASSRRQWYLAAAAYMRSRALLSDLVPHLASASELYPGDAGVLFYSGMTNETAAAPFIQEAILGIVMPRGTKVDVGDARNHLQHARSFFERALESDPRLVEARIRLGRVLGLLGRRETAAGELQRALADAPDRQLRYYAALFLGGEQAALGRADAARQSYELAAALYPHAQSPRLGLSSLAHASGNRTDALAVLLDALRPAEGADPLRDPRWMYFTGPREDGDRLLNAWRATVPAVHAR